jgi:hypothetical protein
MKYIVTIKKENENGDMPKDGENNVYEISTSQLETKWREMGVDWLAADVTLQDLLEEASAQTDV